MADISAVLKSEITRLAKKVVKQHVGSVAKQSAAHRRHVAQLRRQLSELERAVARLSRSTNASPRPLKGDQEETNVRFRAEGLRPLRTRLGLSAADFGRLLGVSDQSVYVWEQGKVRPRRKQVIAIAELRKVGKREARRRLEALPRSVSGRSRKKATKG